LLQRSCTSYGQNHSEVIISSCSAKRFKGAAPLTGRITDRKNTGNINALLQRSCTSYGQNHKNENHSHAPKYCFKGAAPLTGRITRRGIHSPAHRTALQRSCTSYGQNHLLLLVRDIVG